MWTAVEPHGSENYDQTASHGSLLLFEFEPKKKKKNWEEEDDKVGAVWSWNSKLAT